MGLWNNWETDRPEKDTSERRKKMKPWDDEAVEDIENDYGVDHFVACFIAAVTADGTVELSDGTVHSIQTYCDDLGYDENSEPSIEQIEAGKYATGLASDYLREVGIKVPKNASEQDYDRAVGQWMKRQKKILQGEKQES